MEITGRHILITGANRGIGRSFAKICAEDKAHLHLVIRNEDGDLAKELTTLGAKSVTTWTVDLADRNAVSDLVVRLKDVQIDILFNNAGQLTGGLLENQSMEEVNQMLQVNVNSLIQLTHGILPGMLARKRGKIVNNSSVAAYMYFPLNSTYSASKAAVAAFTQCLRGELVDTGVSTLLLITPGIKTRMFDKVIDVFSKNIEVPGDTISPSQYAKMIREAILHDLEVLEPSGLTGWALKAAKFAKPLFDFEVKRRFHRT